MSLVTIEKTTKRQYDCNAYRCPKKTLLKVNFTWNMFQGMSVVLCKDHLNELGCAVADALDPEPPTHWTKKAKKKHAVGWQKVIEDNAKKRVGVYLSEEAMDSGNIMAPREK